MAKKKYSSVRKTEEIELESPTGKAEPYFLMEMMGTDKEVWSSHIGKVFSGDGPYDYAGTQAKLIAMHLHDKNKNKLTEQQVIELLPSSVMQEMFEDCKKLSGLTKEEKDDEKNS